MKVDKVNFDSTRLEIPDFTKDPDGSKGIMKDTVFYSYHLRKHDFWQEMDSSGFYWLGEYQYGKKVGTWVKGKFYVRDSTLKKRFFRIFSIDYQNGVPDSTTSYYFDSVTFSKLKGLWVYNLSRRYHSFEKDSVVLPNEEFLSFIDETTYRYNCLRDNPRHSFDYTACTDEWWLENKVLCLRRNSEILKFKIDTLTKNLLVLEPSSR